MKQGVKTRRFSIQDTGFSSKADNAGKRLLNKDGTFNIKKKGLLFIERFSFYHWLIRMSWPSFFLVMFSGYILINLLFATSYYLGGIDGLTGDHPSTISGKFLHAFYFSSQTLTTVGFGQLSPVSTFHSMLATFESFIGLMSFAMATGLLYGKFSKPRSGIIFSENALISPYRENVNALMIRLANAKEDQIIEVSASIIISWIDPESNGSSRKYYMLPLEMDTINMLVTSWTVVHPINEESPLYKMKSEDLINREAEVIIQLKGYDDSYSQEIHSMSSYKNEEIVWGAKFKKILGQDGEFATLNMDELGYYDKIEID